MLENNTCTLIGTDGPDKEHDDYDLSHGLGQDDDKHDEPIDAVHWTVTDAVRRLVLCCWCCCPSATWTPRKLLLYEDYTITLHRSRQID